MGLSATVMCNCYKNGLDAPAELLEFIYIDQDGYLDLNTSYDGNEALYFLFDKWQRSACPHEDMDIARERIASWAGVYAFKRALEKLGTEIFHTLLQEIPDVNGGTTSPECARKMLAELLLFKNTENSKMYLY